MASTTSVAIAFDCVFTPHSGPPCPAAAWWHGWVRRQRHRPRPALPGRETDQAHPSWSYVQPVVDAPATAMVFSATTATIALSDAE